MADGKGGLPVDISAELKLDATEGLNTLAGGLTQGTGGWYRPIGIRREHKARLANIRDSLELLREQGLLPPASEMKDNPAAIRLAQDAFRHQLNREAIAEAAIEEAARIEGPRDAEIEPEWLDHFWREADLISAEELQAFWGKLLARKATGKSGFSLRSLRLLSELDADDAIEIERMASRVVQLPKGGLGAMGSLTVKNPRHHGYLSRLVPLLAWTFGIRSWSLPLGIHYAYCEGRSPLNRSQLAEIGIIKFPGFNEEHIQIDLRADPVLKLDVSGLRFKATCKSRVGRGYELGVNAAECTSIGEEFCRLISPPADADYIASMFDQLRSEGFDFELEILGET